MKITILVEDANPAHLREIADAVWAAQKDDIVLSPESRDAMKGMSTALHGEAARLEKK